MLPGLAAVLPPALPVLDLPASVSGMVAVLPVLEAVPGVLVFPLPASASLAVALLGSALPSLSPPEALLLIEPEYAGCRPRSSGGQPITPHEVAEPRLNTPIGRGVPRQLSATCRHLVTFRKVLCVVK